MKYHKYSKPSFTQKLNFSGQILIGMGPGPQFQSWLILTCCNEIDGRVAGINRMKLLPTSPGNNNSWNGYHYHYHPWKTDSSILYIKIQWAYSWFNPICGCFCIQIWHQAFNYLRGRKWKRKIFHQWMNNFVNCKANFTAIIKKQLNFMSLTSDTFSAKPLKQFCLVVNVDFRNKLQWNFNWCSNIF